MATVSALSHGSCLGCSLKSVNHEHAPTSGITATNMRPSKRAASPRSALIAHLHGTVATEDVGRLERPIGSSGHPHAVIAVTESRIVPNRQRESRNSRQPKHPGHPG